MTTTKTTFLTATPRCEERWRNSPDPDAHQKDHPAVHRDDGVDRRVREVRPDRAEEASGHSEVPCARQVVFVGRAAEQGSENDGQRGDESQHGGGGQAVWGQFDARRVRIHVALSVGSSHGRPARAFPLRPQGPQWNPSVAQKNARCHGGEIYLSSNRKMQHADRIPRPTRKLTVQGPRCGEIPDEDGSQVKIVSS